MVRPMRLGIAAAVLLGALLSGRLSAGEAGWRVGMAAVDITPQKPIWLAGYGHRTAPADGTLHPLWVKALAMEDGEGRRVAMVTSDLLGFPRTSADRIAAELQSRFALARPDVMLTSSHTHTGPVLGTALADIYPLDDQQRSWIAEYTTELEGKVVAVVGEAIAKLQPAALRAGEGRAFFAVNRRANREPAVPGLRADGQPMAGPSDSTVPVLAALDPDERLLATVFGYACHCTTLSSNQWSGDYAGYAQRELQRRHPGVQAMFFQGCGADQNPIPRRSVELCRQYGRMLAEAVDETLAGAMRPVAPRLRTAWEVVELELTGQPTESELVELSAKPGYPGRWATRLLGELRAGRPFISRYAYPVQVWKLGDDQLWIALGGEVVVDYAIDFRDRYGATTWTAGYSNDVMAYIPSPRVWSEGGYESGAFDVYGLPARKWGEDTPARIRSAVDRLVGTLP